MQHGTAYVDKGVRGAVYSPDGTRILTWGDDSMARLWDAATGATRGVPMEHVGVVESAQFDPSGDRIVTLDGTTRLRVWDGHDGAPRLAPMRHRRVVDEVAWAFGGRALLARSFGEIKLWDTETGLLLIPPLRHRGFVDGLSLSRNGRILLTRSDDRLSDENAADVTIWRLLPFRSTGPSIRREVESRTGSRLTDTGIVAPLP